MTIRVVQFSFINKYTDTHCDPGKMETSPNIIGFLFIDDLHLLEKVRITKGIYHTGNYTHEDGICGCTTALTYVL